jgi:histidyl-tRNA synthetase
MGDVMMGIVLEKYGLLPDKQKTPADVLVTVFDDQRVQSAFVVAAQLRKLGLKVVCYPEAAKLQKQFKYADRVGIRFAVVAGPDEEAAGMVTLKDLQQRSQEILTMDQAAESIRSLLAQA